MTNWHEHNKNFGKNPAKDVAVSNPTGEQSVTPDDYRKMMGFSQSDHPYADDFQQSDSPNAPNRNQQFFNNSKMQDDPEIEIEIEADSEPEPVEQIEIEPDDAPSKEKDTKRDQNSRIKQKLQELNEINSKLNEENLALKKATIEKIDESFHLNHQTIKSEYEKLLAEKKYNEDRAYAWEQEFKNARMNNDIDAEAIALKKRGEYERVSELTNERLSKVKAQSDHLLSEYESFQKNVSQVEKEIMTPTHRVDTYDDFDEEKAENFKEFMQRNSYLDNSFNNPNFSPDLVADVAKISAEITRNYKLNNAGNEVGSRKYFNDVQREIDRMLKKSAPTESRTVKRVSSRTAPVSSENTQRIRMRESEHNFLSKVQREIARSFPDQKDSLTSTFQKNFLHRIKNTQ